MRINRVRNVLLGVLATASVFCLQGLAYCAQPMVAKFYERPFRQEVGTYHPPTIDIGENPKYGKYIYQAAYYPPWYFESLFSIRRADYTYNSEHKLKDFLKGISSFDFNELFKEVYGKMRSIGGDEFFTNYDGDGYGADVGCELFDVYFYIDGDEKNIGERKRLFFITIFDKPTATDDACDERWIGGGPLKVEAHSLSDSYTIVDEGTLYISLPEGLSVLPADRAFFRQLNVPFPLSPWTWVVPGDWLFQHDNFGRHGQNEETKVEAPFRPEFLQENSKKIKNILRKDFPFSGDK